MPSKADCRRAVESAGVSPERATFESLTPFAPFFRQNAVLPAAVGRNAAFAALKRGAQGVVYAK